MIVQERYDPLPVAANGTVDIKGDNVGGFLATTAGSFTLIQRKDDGTTVTLLAAFPVQAGVYYPLPFYLGIHGGSFVAAGGASGLLGV